MERHPVTGDAVRKGLGEADMLPQRKGSCLGQSQVALSLGSQEGGRALSLQDQKGLGSDFW